MREEIIKLLDQYRLKEALSQMTGYATHTSDWQLKNELEALQTSYDLMLQYTSKGMKDPNKVEIYHKMLRTAYELADRIHIAVQATQNYGAYYDTMRTFVQSPPHSYAELQMQLEAYTEDMATAPLIYTTEAKINEEMDAMRKRHETAVDELFEKIWVSTRWSESEYAEAQTLFNSLLIQVNDLSIMVSAVTMSLLQIFDIRKFMFLLNAYTHQDTMLNQRAIAGIALTCYYYEKRILQYPEAVSRINELNENSEFIKNLHHIQIQLLQSSRETRKIDKKMREEIIPEMMKNPKLNLEGQEKSEIVSYEDCLQNGYRIQKNKGYTDYKRSRHTFAGWDQRADVGAKEAAFQENRENRISYEELRKIAASQRTETGESREMAKVALYAIWDRAPEISAPDKEYFEGETVKKEDLLKDVQSTDREDGELTTQIKIVQIEYAPGRLTEDGKADKEVKTWKDGMSSEELLDTWFLQLDKKDSPVTHKVVYQVTDSIGNITEESCSVKIKYNEFPVIEAQDRYFTLQEAQQGAITKEVLKTQAISEGKVKANDTEEGDLSEKLKLLDFHPEEFQKFTDSGYIVLNWHVQDSMGPDGKGKETVRPFTVYVVKDGEIPKAPHKQNVRFISEKYYRINENVDADRGRKRSIQ